MLRRMRHAAWLSLVVCATAAAGTVYKSVGPDGAVIYTDRPGKNAEELKLPDPSTYPPPTLPAAGNAPPFAAESAGGAVYESVRVTAPPNEGTAFAAQGGVDVDVVLQPALMEGHTLTYVVDGKEVAKGLRTDRVRVTDLDRGTHHLEVAVRDEGGRLVARSQRVTFHVRQSSVLDPLREDKEKPEQPIETAPPSYEPPGKPTYGPPKSVVSPYAPPPGKSYESPERPTSSYAPPPKPASSYVPTPPPTPYSPRYTPK